MGVKAKGVLNSFWFYTLAPYLIFLVFIIVPFGMGGWYSLTDWDGIASKWNIVGFDNYRHLVTGDDGFRVSFLFTLRFTLVACFSVNLIGLLYAFLLQRNSIWNGILRVVLVLPNVIGGIILGFVWQFIFSQALPSLGGALGKIAWLGEAGSAFWAIFIVFLWQQAGYVMLIYIAAMKSIDTQLFESARIDGASEVRQFYHITLPLIVPAFTVALFIILAHSFKIFALIFSLTEGGPYGSTESLAINIYNEAFIYGNYGMGSAKAVVFFILVALLTFIQVRLTQRREVSL